MGGYINAAGEFFLSPPYKKILFIVKMVKYQLSKTVHFGFTVQTILKNGGRIAIEKDNDECIDHEMNMLFSTISCIDLLIIHMNNN